MSIINSAFFPAILALVLAATPAVAAEEWEYQLEKGLVQQRAEMYEYALFSLHKSLELHADNPRAARALGEIYAAKNLKERALEFFERSLTLDGNQPSIRVHAGEICEFFQEPERAFTHFRTAAELAPADLMANLSLVRHYLRKKDPAAASRHYEASRVAGLKRSRILLTRARRAVERAAPREAIALYRQVLAESPSLVEAYGALHDLYRQQRDDTSAAEVIERLKFIKPDEERSYVLLGNLYFAGRVRGQRPLLLRRAEDNYKKALALNPNNAETWFSLSDLARFMKRDIDAAAYQKKALELDRAAGR